MRTLKILICGVGFAGPAAAYWLARGGHRVVIVERFPALRVSGAQVDLRAQGIEVVKRMGLLDAVQSKRVEEKGFSFVDSQGNTKGTLLANTSGKGPESLTAEYEIMRGDLLCILYEATKNNVEYVFGKAVERFEQDEKQVIAYFSDGSSDTFDLLIGADGQGSRIRKAILPSNSPDPYRRMGIGIAYWFIPRIETDSNISVIYNAPGGRMIMRRSHNLTETQVYFLLRDNSKELSDIHRAPIEQQKQFWAEKLQGAGWQADRFIEGMKTSENFYSQEVVQISTDMWHKGRVVLLGDAAYCPAPAGMGVTASFVGAYVLAGEINRNPENLLQAFETYDKLFRPFVNEIQNFNPSFLSFMMPKSSWGIKVFHSVVGFVCFLRLPELMARFSKEEKSSWTLPEYPDILSDSSAAEHDSAISETSEPSVALSRNTERQHKPNSMLYSYTQQTDPKNEGEEQNSSTPLLEPKKSRSCTIL